MRSALAFLTVVGGAAPPDARAARSFAPVGALLGLVLGAAWWGAEQLWPPLLAAVLVVTLDAALTGLLHLDGLTDSGDGLLAPLDRKRRLAVMKDPNVGAFGAVVLVLVLLLRVGALASLAPAVLLLAGIWATSRGLMAVTMALVPYARSGGLATDFTRDGPGGHRAEGHRDLGIALAGSAAGLVLVLLAGTIGDSLPLAAAGAAAAGVVAGFGAVLLLARRRLGGYTGDVLGAAGVVGETVALTLAAASW
jgi:adenosylcobinamide-GDP ribazoletransferase